VKKKNILPISMEAIEEVKNNKALKDIFVTYPALFAKQKRIYRILAEGIDKKLIEEYFIKGKDSLKPTKKINLDRLEKEIQILLKSTPETCFVTIENKKLCLDIIEQAINIEKLRRRLVAMPVKNITQKRTVANIKENPRALKIYTILIKKLVNELNPLFRNLRDKWFDRGDHIHKKDKTFKAVADVLNALLPALNFTPEQVKARYNK